MARAVSPERYAPGGTSVRGGRSAINRAASRKGGGLVARGPRFNAAATLPTGAPPGEIAVGGAGSVAERHASGRHTGRWRRGSFVFDGESQLIALYHDEQSPRSAWYCEGEADEAEPPPDDCLGATLRGLQHEDGKDVASDGSVTASDADDLGWAAPLASRYAEAKSLGATAAIDYALTRWATVDAEEGAELTLGAGADATTYLLLHDGSSITILSEGAKPIACESL